jgi:hypothetical protein
VQRFAFAMSNRTYRIALPLLVQVHSLPQRDSGKESGTKNGGAKVLAVVVPKLL